MQWCRPIVRVLMMASCAALALAATLSIYNAAAVVFSGVSAAIQGAAR